MAINQLDQLGTGSLTQTYQQQLQNLMQNPNAITQTPGYQAGLEGVERTMGAQGYQGSGNMMSALQGYSGDFYNKQMTLLGSLYNTSRSGDISQQAQDLNQQKWSVGRQDQLTAGNQYMQMMQQFSQPPTSGGSDWLNSPSQDSGTYDPWAPGGSQYGRGGIGDISYGGNIDGSGPGGMGGGVGQQIYGPTDQGFNSNVNYY